MEKREKMEKGKKEKKEKKEQNEWHIVFFDLETVPSGIPTKTKRGRLIPSAKASKPIQISLVRYTGEIIIDTLNINPEINWQDIGILKNYAKRAWNISEDNLPTKAKEFSNLKTVWPLLMSKLKSIGTRIILAGHNIHSWDMVIINTRMSLEGLSWPSDLEIKTWDTRSVFKQWSICQPKEKRWNLGFLYNLAFKENIINQHTALADTLAMHRLIKYLIKQRFPNKSLFTEQDLVDELFSKRTRGVKHQFRGLDVAKPFLPSTRETSTSKKLNVFNTLDQSKQSKDQDIPSKKSIEINETKKEIKVSVLTKSGGSAGLVPLPNALTSSRGGSDGLVPQIGFKGGSVEPVPQIGFKGGPGGLAPLASSRGGSGGLAPLYLQEIKHGVIPGFGKLTAKRIRDHYHIKTFGQLFHLYKDDKQFKKLLLVNSQHPIANTTISNLCLFASKETTGETAKETTRET